MKKQQKIQHRSPSRKSPRLSSSTQVSAQTKPGSKARPGNAWALSLHVVDQPPLEIRYPSPGEDKSIRRSSRFTTNKYRTPPPKSNRSRGETKAPPALAVSRLRKSPRFSPSPSSPPLTLTDGKNLGLGKEGSNKRRRSIEGEQDGGRGGKKGKLGPIDGSLRRSLRLSGGKIGNSQLHLLSLPEPGSKSASRGCLTSSARCLRSKTVLTLVEDEKAKVDKIRAEKNGGELSTSGKCLRSRVIERDLIELDEVSEKRVASSGSRELRSLRSRTVTMPVGREKEKAVNSSAKKNGGELSTNGKCLRSRVIECDLIEPAGVSEKRVSNSCSRELRSLRSRTVTIHVEREKVKSDNSLHEKNGGDMSVSGKNLRSRETEYPLIEWHGDSETTNVKKKGLKSRAVRRDLQKESVEKSASVKSSSPPKSDSALGKSCYVNEDEIEPKKEKEIICCFIGEPIPEDEAQKRWQWRYELKSKKTGESWKINAGEEDEIILNVDCHYAQAKVGSGVLEIGDCVFVKGEGIKKHIGRILEFFRTMEGEDYFRVQWFFRAEDTVLKDAASSHDKRRLFYSTLMNDNLLDCIISKVNVVRIPPALCTKSNSNQSAAFYYDMEYCVEYSTFRTLVPETSTESQSISLNTKHSDEEPITFSPLDIFPKNESLKQELTLLDLYAGCGGMSTGLCFGAKLSNLNLVTKWAVDLNSSACESLKLNHPETKVRNESTDNFLELLKQWKKLCKLYVGDLERALDCELADPHESENCTAQSDSDSEESSEEYEVSFLVDICYGDPNKNGKCGLHFKVRWKGYGPDDDTWEPIESLSNSKDCIKDFVRKGFKSKILPLPGDVDVVCGGPPCQGISGYNRYRNFVSPLTDERNRQIIVFMDIAEFLKPKYILMENVVDIIRFDNASLGRYALSRLVRMKYQSKLGTIASGCYGLPQFRLRVFIWGAHPRETLPRFPLPTHEVVVRNYPPLEFGRNIVGYDEGQPRTLENPITLVDSISDLPPVTNEETLEERIYEKPPETDFQTYIRLTKDEMMGFSSKEKPTPILYDHRPLKLSEHDYLRVLQVPHRKGANYRDFAGVIVGEDNVARKDPSMEAVMLPTGRPLVPESTLTFENGRSKKPYARLWWDETVSTLVTFPHVRAQAILHPEQDRLLTVRECARLQGFPDFYRFCGTVKERYCQLGNAVSIPVARALGYALGMAYRKVEVAGDEHLMVLPEKFSSRVPSVDEVVDLG
ncbi:hypothetical protein ABFS82_01G055000 [Erythranthe guttata]|uniref:DNA (cytosine-5)-methyltransferase CMT3 n=1 Tax=Erythranthe guttata TaxID=4155 RepID=UPI00064DC59D|nr:PREDICTED: DNA (cytosine-5)-methyltransferase CMT3 [Erythranthe guttata]|eukprot:XP_012854237.1 PREDICTED: DNA (cytosine-5)-methyltransferase CMT3 [Erythranthe guttata]